VKGGLSVIFFSLFGEITWSDTAPPDTLSRILAQVQISRTGNHL